MERSKKQILESLFDEKIINVIHFLINQNKETFLKEISENTNVPPATTLRILHNLEDEKLLIVRKVGRTPLYKWNEGEETGFLDEIFKEQQNPLEPFLALCHENPSIHQVVLHGNLKPEKTNLLVIGKNIDNELLHKCSQSIKEETGFTLSFMCLNKEQYQQMTGMGLYSGKKTVLYSL